MVIVVAFSITSHVKKRSRMSLFHSRQEAISPYLDLADKNRAYQEPRFQRLPSQILEI